MNRLLRPPIWLSFRASSDVPSAWLPATKLGTSRTSSPCDALFQVRFGFDLGFRISDFKYMSTIDDIELTVQISPFVLWFSRAFQQIFNPHSAIRIPQSSTRLHVHLHGLATAIHETSGLEANFRCCCLLYIVPHPLEND